MWRRWSEANSAALSGGCCFAFGREYSTGRTTAGRQRHYWNGVCWTMPSCGMGRPRMMPEMHSCSRPKLGTKSFPHNFLLVVNLWLTLFDFLFFLLFARKEREGSFLTSIERKPYRYLDIIIHTRLHSTCYLISFVMVMMIIWKGTPARTTP